MIDRIGALVEIRPAYSSETGERSIWDEYAGCAARIVRSIPGTHYFEVRLSDGSEVEMHIQRLKFREPT